MRLGSTTICRGKCPIVALSVALITALTPLLATPQPAVPAYTAVDLRLVWRIDPRVDVTFAARNAFDPGHVEYRLDPYTTEIERSFLVGLRLQLP